MNLVVLIMTVACLILNYDDEDDNSDSSDNKDDDEYDNLWSLNGQNWLRILGFWVRTC